MQDKTSQAAAALQAAKQKGLSYYDAVQSLKTQGFDQADIDGASDLVHYNLTDEQQKEEVQELNDQRVAVEEEGLEDRIERGFNRL
jgi:hypothetical protein